jgi:hypothetical protein
MVYHLPARHEAKREYEKCEFETRYADANEVAYDWFHVSLVGKYQLLDERGASIFVVKETKTAVVSCPNYNRKSTRCCFICPSFRRWDSLKL